MKDGIKTTNIVETNHIGQVKIVLVSKSETWIWVNAK